MEIDKMKKKEGASTRADKAEGESAVLATIAAMPDRAMGERLHAIIKASAQKFKERYMTLGFNQEANLDHGHMWPIAFALKELTAVEEARIGALVKKAVN
jgi:hypothetical protein